ncbi:MAG: hemerythrin family protein [Bacillales bacterium]|jgi:hemerythrin-like metal-binding protein|nr:hemerythrin family protein [Bacillales bacterium]
MKQHWNATFELGNELIDGQHKTLVEETDKLSNKLESGNIGKEEILETLRFLATYAVQHFTSEEKVSKDADYPNRLQHNSIHNEFKKTVGEVLEKYVRLTSDEECTAFAKDICDFLTNWLAKHIKGDDFLLFQYIKSKKN